MLSQEFWLCVNVYFLDISVDFSGSLVQTTVTVSEETPGVARMETNEKARSKWPSLPQYLSEKFFVVSRLWRNIGHNCELRTRQVA